MPTNTVHTLQLLKVISIPRIESILPSPDGKQLLVYSMRGHSETLWDPEIAIIDLISGNQEWVSFTAGAKKNCNLDCLQYVPGHPNWLCACDGGYGDIRIVDLQNRTVVWAVRELHPPVARFAHFRGKMASFVAIDPAGKRVITNHGDRSLRVFEVETGNEVQKLKGHLKYPMCGLFHPSTGDFFTGGMDKRLRFWDLDSGNETRVINNLPLGPWWMELALDYKAVVMATNERGKLYAVDLKSGETISTMKGHTNGFMYGMTVTPDRRRAISAGSDRHLKLWDIASGKLLAQAEMPSQYEQWVEFGHVAVAPDNSVVYAGTFTSKDILVYELPKE